MKNGSCAIRQYCQRRGAGRDLRRDTHQPPGPCRQVSRHACASVLRRRRAREARLERERWRDVRGARGYIQRLACRRWDRIEQHGRWLVGGVEHHCRTPQRSSSGTWASVRIGSGVSRMPRRRLEEGDATSWTPVASSSGPMSISEFDTPATRQDPQ